MAINRRFLTGPDLMGTITYEVLAVLECASDKNGMVTVLCATDRGTIRLRLMRNHVERMAKSIGQAK